MTSFEDAPSPVPPSNAGMSLAWWLIFVILCFYLLSVGPAAKMAEAGLISDSTLVMVYAPLDWLARNSEPANRILDWYLTKVWHWDPPIPPK